MNKADYTSIATEELLIRVVSWHLVGVPSRDVPTLSTELLSDPKRGGRTVLDDLEL